MCTKPVSDLLTITALPDDILLHIFHDIHHFDEILSRSCEPGSLIHNVLWRMCRRFRDLISATPVFWSVISTRWSLRKLQDFVKYSGDILVSININCDYVVRMNEGFVTGSGSVTDPRLRACDAYLVGFAKAALDPTASRCKLLNIRAAGINVDGVASTLLILRNTCPVLHFPELVGLDLKCGGSYSYIVGDEIFGGEYSVSLLDGWSIPRLRHLKTIAWIPHLAYSNSNSNLTSIELKIVGDYSCCWPSPDEVIELLRDSPVLQYLTLAIRSHHFPSPSSRSPDVVLRNLKMLTLDLRQPAEYGYESPHPLSSFTQSFYFPSLETIRMFMWCGDLLKRYYSYPGWVYGFRELLKSFSFGAGAEPASIRSPALKEVVLSLDMKSFVHGTIRTKMGTELVPALCAILERLPHIQHLRLLMRDDSEQDNMFRYANAAQCISASATIDVHIPGTGTVLHLVNLPMEEGALVPALLQQLSTED